MLRSLGCLSKTSTGHHGLKFLEGLFRYEKLSTSHKTKTENSLALSFAIFVFQRCIFSLKIQNVGLENHLIVRARQPFCWKWISLLKPFKNMPRVMLRSLSTQILMHDFPVIGYSCCAHRILGSPGGKHCQSLQRIVWRGVVSPLKAVSLDIECRTLPWFYEKRRWLVLLRWNFKFLCDWCDKFYR